MAPERTPLDEHVRDALLTESRERIFGEGRAAELFHIVLMVIVAALALDAVPDLLLGVWAAAIAGAVALRGALRHRLRTRAFDQAAQRAFRVSIAALALSWGVGAALFSHLLPFQDVALILVVVSGMIAAATATLAADTTGFRLFLAGATVPFAVGILTGTLDEPRLVALLLLLVFATAMVVIHRRAHAALLEQVRTIVRLGESEARAARERVHLDALFASAPVAIVVLDTDGRVLDANPRFQTMFGYALADALGQPLNDLIVPPTETGHAAMLDETVRGGATVVADVKRRRKGGELIAVRGSAARVEDAEGQRLFVLYEDISDEVAARHALEEAREAAERVAQMRSAFLANMSHEIRTPMNAVLGLTELLLDSELAPEQRRSLTLIQTSGEALLTVLNDILDLSKIEAERLHLEAVTFDLPRLVDSAVGLLAARARERGVELLTDIASDVPEQVRADPTRLRQVLNNLVGNAIKFTHEGEVLVSLARVEGGGDGKATVRFAVRDTGIGIPADLQAAIFQPFSQADLSMARKYGGTGLGLTIAQRLVAMMGGALRVSSEVGKGSEFSFTIDVLVEPGVPAPLPSPASVPLAGLRMLIVDDNQSNRRIVREMLAAVGVEVTEAAGADEGLDALRHAAQAGKPFALTILDAQMPGRDGFELAGMARADAALKVTRLLMLTSAGQRGDAQRCRELGIRGYLTKPVSRADLLDMVAGVLGGPDEAGGVTPEVVTRHRIHESRRQLRVLLAEDNQVNQEVAATMLRRRGHQVDVVDNGRQAVERARRQRYDVVLMDIQMPEMDGLEATEAIRALPDGHDLPIVALTAHALKDERERCLTRGMNAYLTKPFKAYELFAAAEGWGARTAPPSPPPPAPVDVETFRRDMAAAGAGDAVDAIISSFVENLPQSIAAIAEAVAAGRATEVARLAHAAKSSAAQLGAQRLATLLAELEQEAKDGRVDRLKDRLAQLTSEAEAAVGFLKKGVGV